MARKVLLRSRLPIITIFIVFSTLIVYAWSNLTELFVYDRAAIFKGELWRIITAPLVHFSLDHLFWNMLVFSVAGWLLESAEVRGLWVVYAFAAITPSLMFLWTSPELTQYGGLSGLATGGVTYFSLFKTTKSDKDKLIWLAILILVGVKIIFEVVTSKPIFVHGELSFKTLPTTHVLGCIGAIVTWTWLRLGKKIPTG